MHGFMSKKDYEEMKNDPLLAGLLLRMAIEGGNYAEADDLIEAGADISI